MKIEKVNDNQIRCTLTREDLDHRQLKLSELAYGTEKAKSLFREMMQQASYEFGFEAEDIPLMIEAIPLSSDAIILIITKVEYPEELDTRFSKFSEPSEEYENSAAEASSEAISEGADNILDLFGKIQKRQNAGNSEKSFVPLKEAISKKAKKAQDSSEDVPVSIPVEVSKLFVFHNLDALGDLSLILSSFYDDYNTLYKKADSSRYCLIIRKGHHSPEDFNKVCNILSEYSHQEKYLPATEAYMDEHYDILIPRRAIQTLAKI